MNAAMMIAAATGAASGLLYLRRRRWIDAALALAAGGALAALLGMPGAPGAAPEVRLDTTRHDDALRAALLAVPAAQRITVTGDGLRDAEWRDLPAKPLAWQRPSTDTLALHFERTVPLGRTFALTVARGAASEGWRLQLLAENGVVLDEAVARNGSATVRWVPPVAETLLLRARVLDGKGAVLGTGPVPVRVVDAVPLQVIGRFGAPSFDTRTLNDLLAASGALLDWQTVLGKAITRTETPDTPLTQPNLIVVDAAYIERQAGARAALLARVAEGVPLLVLGGNAGEPGVWQQLRLPVAAQSATTEKEDTRHVDIAGVRLALPPASFNPVGWSVLARDDDGKPYLWQRDWQRGRIAWLGVGQWHRNAITAPAALGQWWQRVLDHAATGTPAQVTWTMPDPMPLPGLRTEVCAQGVRAGEPVHIGARELRWQRRTDRADALCVAWWPEQAGWVNVRSGSASTQVYVHAAGDWPAWQAQLRREATARYAARSLPSATTAAVADGQGVPAWPFALLCAAALLALWWRERR